MEFPILLLKKDRERSLINRHPWVFSGAIHKHPKAVDGAIVEVQSLGGQFLGYGFYASKSQITCKIFEFDATEYNIQSKAYWKHKIDHAFQLRKSLVISNQTNCYRLIHAEGDFFPGLIADVYHKVVVLQVLTLGMENLLTYIKEALQELGFEHIYVKSKNSTGVLEQIKADSYWLTEPSNSPIEVLENGLKFQVDFVEGQKTGFFIDQRENRQLLKSLSKGKKVLNTFSYTGGFSVYALAGNAEEVHSLDISERAVNMSVTNVALNDLQQHHQPIVSDCFDYLKELKQDYFDIIVLDPPAFAKHARAVANASRGYKQINMKAIQKIKSGGLLFTFSCSQNISKELFQKIVFSAATDAKRNVRIVQQLHQTPDHPINIFHPEGDTLKDFCSGWSDDKV
jgi:23S rRNA (cytosine1962-C5)-methyltransferase